MKARNDNKNERKSSSAVGQRYKLDELPEELPDPEKDRQMHSVLKPFVGYAKYERVFPKENKELPDWKYIMYIM